jgi:anti-sigma regulatory factor (Ser/Thr protein kinase)
MSGCIGTVMAEHHPVTTSAADGDALRPVLRLSAVELRPLPGAVPSARLHTRFVLCEWGFPAIATDAELIVSELVTNAVVHGSVTAGAAAGQPPVRLRLSGRAGGVCVEVWDCGEEMPRLRADPLSEEPGGRGLLLVAELASRWGACRTEGGGKRVWAALVTPGTRPPQGPPG